MAIPQTPPVIKMEPSLLDTLASKSPSCLFSPASPLSHAATVNPLDVLTPKTMADDDQSPPPFSAQSETPDPPDPGDEAAVPTDKKPTKKRKSWGQVLPEPKTNLPPRKRAKTEDEKEQRRVERVLRNRRAAQSSRERKRLEVEALEKRNKELEVLLQSTQQTNLMLLEELNRFRRDSGVVTRSSSPLDSLRDNPVTLSQQLFSSQDGHQLKSASDRPADPVGDFIMSTSLSTVNPASLSPSLAPVSDPSTKESPAGQATAAASSDLTQRPAEMLCDLQCHKSAEAAQSLASRTLLSPMVVWTLHLRMLLLSASAILSVCHRPLMQIAISSKAGFSLLPTPQVLTTIIWLVTLSPASRARRPLTSSTSTTSSTKTKTTSPQTLWHRAMMSLQTTDPNPKFMTLRFKSLRKILSCSPNLARPLMDATMEALRLVSKGCDDRVVELGAESRAMRDDQSTLTQLLGGIKLPSAEVLMTLLWTLSREEAKIRRRREAHCRSPSRILEGAPTTATTQYVLRVSGKEDRRLRKADDGVRKRRRMA